jgi:hypothetical protein
MIALAQAFQVARPVVGGMVIEMGGGEHDTGASYTRCLDDVRPARPPPASIAQDVSVRVEPASIGETADGFAARPSAFLAQTARPLEPHMPAQLASRSDRTSASQP